MNFAEPKERFFTVAESVLRYMEHKPIARFVITPLAVAGILILAILATTVNAQESNGPGNGQESGSSGPGNGQESGSSSPGNGQESGSSSPGNGQESGSSSTGNGQESSNAGNATSTGGPTANNTTSTGGPTANNTTSPSGPYNATLTGVPENMKNSNNETAADFANNILAVHNRERADVKVPALVWSNKLTGRRQDLGRPDGGYTRLSPRHRASGEARRG